MKILLIEPFFTGSHKKWAVEFKAFSRHRVELLTMSGHHWKWRMHGGAVTLSKKFLDSGFQPDLILASDMLDLSVFLSLTRKKTAHIPSAVYFHENQVTYPWSPDDKDVQEKRNRHYGFINYTTALAADRVFFNSHYHLNAFLGSLPGFLKAFPDHNEMNTVEAIRRKSQALPLCMDLKRIQQLVPAHVERPERAVLLWNHRWEYDKNPEGFLNACLELKNRGVGFKLIILGENFKNQPGIFDRAKQELREEILHIGYCEPYEEYIRLTCQADILPVTSYHDFFGASVVEAMCCNVVPLLPMRLAYPEHIPAKYHGTFFYNDQRDLVNRLQRLIFNVAVLRKQKVDHFILRYDWANMMPEYDEALEAVFANSR